MSDPLTPPQQPFTAPYTDVPFTEIPAAGPAAYPPPPGSYPSGTYPPPGTYPAASYPPALAAPGLSENSAAALSYITIIPAIVFLVLEPYNRMPLVRFHAVQCLCLAGVSFVLQFGLSVTRSFLHFIPLIGVLFSMLHLLVFLAIFAAWLIALVKASQGQWFKLPIIGDFAEQQARR